MAIGEYQRAHADMGGISLSRPTMEDLVCEAGSRVGGCDPAPVRDHHLGTYSLGGGWLLFTALLADERGDQCARGVLLPRWTQEMVAGRENLVPGLYGYHDHQSLLYRCALSYLRDTPLALHGHTGLGKTEAVRCFAALLGAPLYRMNLHGLSTTDDIIGKLLPVGQGRVAFQDGLVTTAVRCGGRVHQPHPYSA